MWSPPPPPPPNTGVPSPTFPHPLQWGHLKAFKALSLLSSSPQYGALISLDTFKHYVSSMSVQHVLDLLHMHAQAAVKPDVRLTTFLCDRLAEVRGVVGGRGQGRWVLVEAGRCW